jgi:hypothetical protein
MKNLVALLSALTIAACFMFSTVGCGEKPATPKKDGTPPPKKDVTPPAPAPEKDKTPPPAPEKDKTPPAKDAPKKDEK